MFEMVGFIILLFTIYLILDRMDRKKEAEERQAQPVRPPIDISKVNRSQQALLEAQGESLRLMRFIDKMGEEADKGTKLDRSKFDQIWKATEKET